MKTNKDYTTPFKHYGLITVPAGTKVTHQTACGLDEKIHFVNEYNWIDKNYPDFANILKMDVSSYGIDVPKEFIDYEIILPEVQSDGTPTNVYITEQEAIDKLGATLKRLSDFSNPIYNVMGKEYIIVDGVLHTMTPDWEEPDYPVRKTAPKFASYFAS
jgi:hypothetical protein